jgi:hypothetical protein
MAQPFRVQGVEWTKEWLGTRLTIVGRVVAASVDRDCIDDHGLVVHERLRTAQHCGQAYGAKFIGGQEVMDIAMTYDGPDPKAYVEGGGRTRAAMQRDDNKGSS